MNEVIILDEMLEAGVEALLECHGKRLSAADVVIQVYSAMEAVKAMATTTDKGNVH